MSPEEKAIQLLEKLIPHVYNEYDGSDGGKVYNAKRHTIQCALILVNEIIDAIDWHEYETPNKELNYWLDVRKELEKL